MELRLLQYQANQDLSLLKEYLLTFSLFSQMHYFIGQSAFNSLLKYFQVFQINQSDPVQINSKNMYIFMTPGVLISKKQNKQAMQKYHRMSRRAKFSQLTKTIGDSNAEQAQKFKNVTSKQILNQSLLYNSSCAFSSNQYYISNQSKVSALICLYIKNIPQQLIMQIRQKHHEKLKYIMTTQLFKHLQRHQVQSSLKYFELIKISFDEYLFKQNLRKTKIFVIIKGEVQIITRDKKKKIKKFPTIILTNQQLEMAKSISQYCIAFMIQKEQVINILKKNMQGKYRNEQTQYYLNQILKHQKILEDELQKIENQKQEHNYYRHSEPVSSLNKQNDSSIIKRQIRGGTFPIQKMLKKSESKQNFNINYNRNKTANISQKKKFRIKEHFTNTLNQHYQEYSQKKKQFLQKKGETPNQILYKMKTLVAKKPNMQQINKKLKQQRKNKLLRCKQNIIYIKQDNLNLINLRKYQQFEQSKIMTKIKNNMSQIFRKKQRKHYWKYPNSSAFNKLVQLSF